MSWSRSELKDAVLAAIRAHGGKAHLSQIAKHIWDNNEPSLRNSPLLYTWQYDMRWAATKLRHDGVLRQAEDCEKGVWELA